jgi:glycosyltransferase involved in cell wall biosynthesis
MKIVYLDPADFVGGAELFTLDLLSAFANNPDVEITVLTTGNTAEYLDRIPAAVTVMQTGFPRLRPFRFFAFLSSLLKIRAIVQKIKPDIIHANTVRSGMIALFLPYKKTFFAHDFTAPRFLIIGLRFFSAVFACSQAVKNHLLRRGLRGKEIDVVPNGIDLERFDRIAAEKNSKNPEAIAVAIIGRIDEWKGQDVFLKAAKILLASDQNLRFIIIGEASEHDTKTKEFKQRLEEYIAANRLTTAVEFAGFVPIETALKQTDLLVHASTAPEPFGRVIIEAMAAGVPVIATNIGGPCEIFNSSSLKAALIEPNNPPLFAQKIDELVRDTSLRQSLVIAGRERAKDFDLRYVAGLIEQKWRALIRR